MNVLATTGGSSGDGGDNATAREFACVFCGSSSGRDPAFIAAAKSLGRALLRRDLGLVYGGGTIGLMGALSTTVAPPQRLVFAVF